MPLDHTAYPHLLDAIFAASDHGALLGLRSANRAFRDRADSTLFAHISVHVADDTVYLHSPSPSFSSPALRRLPSLPFPALASKKRQAALAAKLAHTCTLDLHAPLPVEYAAWFRQYRTVRRAPLAAGTLLPAHTYVEYLDLSTVGRGLAGEWMADVPDRLRRSVIHLSWRRCDMDVRKIVNMTPCIPRGVEIVIVLEPAGEVGEKEPNVLKEVMRVASRIPRAAVTIVGLERLSPAELGLTSWEGTYGDVIRDAAADELVQRGGRSDSVKLLSWEEWGQMEETALL